MATATASDLEDDIAVQRVILSSLNGEMFDGAEDERREARESIAKLQKRLRLLRAEAQVESSQSQQHGAAESSNTGSGLPHGSQQHPAVSSRDEERPLATNPIERDGNLQDMESPQPANGVWGGPFDSGSLASRNRKRDYDAATLAITSENQHKSRRTSPSPAAAETRSPFSTQGSEVIDLTSFDDGDDANHYLSRAKREEERRAQEKRDYDYAISISSDDSAPAMTTSSSTQPSGPNAFRHLMATQRANAYAPGQQTTVDANTWSQPSFAEPLGSHSRLPASSIGANDTTPQVPGAYDPAWDEVQTPRHGSPPPGARYIGPISSSRFLPYNNRAARYGPVGPTRILPQGHTGGSTGPHNQYTPPWMATPVSNRLPQLRGEYSSYTSPPAANAASPMRASALSVEDLVSGDGQPIQPQLTRADMPSWSGFRQQMLAGTLNGTLSNIINRTSAYDFANRTDANGYPLSSRIASYLDDTDPYADPEMTAKELEELLQNIEPEVQVPIGLQGITPEALTTPLYKHQEVALTWMKKMEEGTNKGGILADDMGLGKTISTLALIHERKSISRPKTNLIVAPVALMRQWEDEIFRKSKSSHRLSVFVYHGKKSTPDNLMTYDVVLTTYGTVAAELKRLDKWHEDRVGREKDMHNDRDLAVKCPLLHPTRARFHRVILDEAQCIKNEKTQTAKACHRIRAQYRWCLTGTPMMNGVVELYSLLKFLQIKPYHIWENFRQAFGVLFGKRGDSKSTAMRRLRVLLKAILLRRKKNSIIDGKPIVELPEKTEAVSYAALNDDERDFYGQLESKSQVIFNKYLREGSVGKNYANVLVLLLRLRQACCHPHLNLDVDDIAPAVDGNMLERVKKLEDSTVNRIKQIEAFECPVCYDVMTSPTFFFPCGHDCCRPCLAQLVDNAAQNNIQAGNESSKAQCITCRTEFDPQECFAYEAFQQVHMPEEYAKQKAEAEAAEQSDSDDSDTGSVSDMEPEHVDSNEIDSHGNLKDFVVPDSDDELDDSCPPWSSSSKYSKGAGKEKEVKCEVKFEIKGEHKDEVKGEGEAPSSLECIPKREYKQESVGKEDATHDASTAEKKTTKGKKKKKEKSKGKGKTKASDVKPSMLKALRKESFKNRKAYKKYMDYLRHTWLPSAKVDECVRLLKDFQRDGLKTIIFSQWTLLLDLIEVAMGHDIEKKPLRYDGSMSATERAIAAQDFRDKRDCKVLLVSLRAGNAGLNLTAASRVIIMDPFWNPYIEMQAVDRAYRIGQKNEVKVYRILTQDTVEDRIVELQERKKEIVEAALDENAGKQLGRLSVAELRYLFTGRR